MSGRTSERLNERILIVGYIRTTKSSSLGLSVLNESCCMRGGGGGHCMGDIFHHISFLANHGQECGGRGDLDIEA